MLANPIPLPDHLLAEFAIPVEREAQQHLFGCRQHHAFVAGNRGVVSGADWALQRLTDRFDRILDLQLLDHAPFRRRVMSSKPDAFFKIAFSIVNCPTIRSNSATRLAWLSCTLAR